MKFYQVNQKNTFEREFNAEYLCCPNGVWGGWPLMKELRNGDILFHYNSICRAVLGISRVTDMDHHKGVASEPAFVIPGTQCIQYDGRHMSESDFPVGEQKKIRENYSSFLEVHTVRFYKKNLGRLLRRSRQVYLDSIHDGEARNFLAAAGIRLDTLNL